MSRRGRARGGKGGSEPRARVRLRELRVMEQILEGRTQHQIAAGLAISQPAVSKIVRRIEDRLLADVALKVERQRARHTLRLEFVYAEAIRAWRASQQEAVRRRQRKTESGPGRAGGNVAEIVSEARHGDPRYLEEARRALGDLRAIWGVDAPERLSIGATTPFASLSDVALEAELARQDVIVRRLTQPPTPTADAPPEREHES